MNILERILNDVELNDLNDKLNILETMPSVSEELNDEYKVIVCNDKALTDEIEILKHKIDKRRSFLVESYNNKL